MATAAIYAARFLLVDQVVPPQSLALSAATLGLIEQLIATFYLIALFTMAQVILEHLGFGVRVLLVTVVSEIATIALCLYMLPQGLPGLVLVMNGVAIATFAMMAVVFVQAGRDMARKAEVRDVV